MSFIQRFRDLKPLPGELGIGCLGQAGFLLKNSAGIVIVLDAYLGDSCEKAFGFKRKIAAPAVPEELSADIVAATHSHMDHLDREVLTALASSAFFIGAVDCETEVVNAGFPPERRRFLRPGETFLCDEVEFTAVYADHGELAPDAIGFYIVSDGVRLYVTGDTSYCPDKLTSSLGDKELDVMIVPINPAFGNPGERNAAELGRVFSPKVLIGAHFGMFDAHGGDPDAFITYCRNELPVAIAAYTADAGRIMLFSTVKGITEV